MPSKSLKYKQSLQLIADILSLEYSTVRLKERLKSESVDWENFVIIASDYLVLTSCYCSLKRKELLQFIPKDLEVYLEEITKINRNRNLSLTEEISKIASLLNASNINYVFLKGSAFLLYNYYDDLGERMIGDIDILVEENQLKKAYDILIDYNYITTPQGISARFFDHKHLPRLKSDVRLAAVEVHKKLILKSINGILEPNSILTRKQYINGYYLPSNDDLIYHSILNFQDNDSGHFYSRISFKSIYDLLILKRKIGLEASQIPNHSFFRSYFAVAKQFFSDFDQMRSSSISKHLFLFKLKFPFVKRTIDFVLNKLRFLKTILTSRIWTFIKNKNYRKALFEDYKRILGLSQ